MAQAVTSNNPKTTSPMRVQHLTFDEIAKAVQELIAVHCDGRPIRVLEAGCGTGRKGRVFGLKPNAHIVGIDTCEEVLGKNNVVSEKILGDIQTYPFRPSDFDLIICHDVLEHLPNPQKALSNFASAIRGGGLIVIASPIVNSVKGIVTKLTPHSVHVIGYRSLLGNKDAGKPGFGPFPAYLRWSISPSSMVRFAKDHGLTIEYFQLYHGRMWDRIIRKSRILGKSYYLFGRIVELLSFGRITAEMTDFMMVLGKPAG